MAQLKESELKKQIKEKAFVPLYFLYGEEKYLISHYTEAIVNKVLGKSYSDFNFQAFDGGKASIDEIADAAQALPLFAEHKCVLVKDLNVEALNAGELAKLYQLLEELSETTVLIISQSTLEIDAKRSAKWKKFIAAAEKNGTVVLLEKRGEIALEKQLVQWAEKRGCGLTQINAGKIIQLCGDDLLTLSSELEKLCAYAVGREITMDDIDLLVTKNLETTVFVLGNALMAGNYDKAYQQLDLLFYQKEEPVAVLAVLSSNYVNLYRAKTALESGEKTSVLSKDFDYRGRDFLIRNAERDCKRASISQLRKSLFLLAQADLALKSGRSEPRTVLEELIGKMMLLAREEKV